MFLKNILQSFIGVSGKDSQLETSINNPSEFSNDINGVQKAMAIDLSHLTQIDGFVGACLVDSESGMVLGKAPSTTERATLTLVAIAFGSLPAMEFRQSRSSHSIQDKLSSLTFICRRRPRSSVNWSILPASRSHAPTLNSSTAIGCQCPRTSLRVILRGNFT